VLSFFTIGLMRKRTKCVKIVCCVCVHVSVDISLFGIGTTKNIALLLLLNSLSSFLVFQDMSPSSIWLGGMDWSCIFSTMEVRKSRLIYKKESDASLLFLLWFGQCSICHQPSAISALLLLLLQIVSSSLNHVVWTYSQRRAN
jgi:hypothetical protein